MRKLLIIIFFLSFFISTVKSQNIDWRVVHQIGDNTGNEEVLDMSQDSEGNIYSVGYFYGEIDFGNQNIVSQGNMDGFLIKMNCKGEYVWIKHLSGQGWDEIRAVTVDKDDNIIIAGAFGNGGVNASLDNLTITSSGNSDVFVAKCDSQGNFTWINTFGSSEADKPSGIASDEKGDIYLTGYFKNTISFGNQSISSNGEMDLFVSKISNAGNQLWFYSAGGISFDYGNSIEILDSSVYVSGNFQDVVDFGTGLLPSLGSYDIFLLSIDTSNTNLFWVNTYGTNNLDGGYDMKLNTQEELLMCGEFAGLIDFGNNISISSQSGNYNGYIVKFNKTGDAIWAHPLLSNDDVYAYGCQIDMYDNVYITGVMFSETSISNLTLSLSGGLGSYYSNIFLFMLDNDGFEQWGLNIPGQGLNNLGYSIEIAPSNDIFLAGRVDGINTFGTLPSISGDLNNSQSAFISLYGRPFLELSSSGILDSIISCDQLLLKANDGALNYIWYEENTIIQQGSIDSVYNNNPSMYIVEDEACKYDSDTLHILSNMDLTLNVDNPILYCIGDEILIEINGGNTYDWIPQDNLSCNNCSSPLLTAVEDMVYTVIVKEEQCTDTLYISTIEDQPCTPENIYIPNAFSPNGDGVNDVFNIVYTGQLEGEIKIFNRLGNMVYQGQINNPWDGYNKNSICPQGVYIYYLDYLDYNEQTKTKTGFLTLIR